MRAIGNLWNWFHFLGLRKDGHAQHEIRVYADAVGEIIKQIWPRAYNLFEEYDLYGKRLSRTETDMIRHVLLTGFGAARLYTASKPAMGEGKALRFVRKFFPDFEPMARVQ
jgi:thymidylate synthase ThyX